MDIFDDPTVCRRSMQEVVQEFYTSYTHAAERVFTGADGRSRYQFDMKFILDLDANASATGQVWQGATPEFCYLCRVKSSASFGDALAGRVSAKRVRCKLLSTVHGLVPAHLDLGLGYDFYVPEYWHHATGMDGHNRSFLITAARRAPDAVDEQVERIIATASRWSRINLPRGSAMQE
eukprot:gene1032-14085_t